jgi:hypothetical protein
VDRAFDRDQAGFEAFVHDVSQEWGRTMTYRTTLVHCDAGKTVLAPIEMTSRRPSCPADCSPALLSGMTVTVLMAH